MISQEKWIILTPLQKLPKNVEDLGKLLLPMALKSFPKFKKSPNLVTLLLSIEIMQIPPMKHAPSNQWPIL